MIGWVYLDLQSRGCWLTVNYVPLGLSSPEIVIRRNFRITIKATVPDRGRMTAHEIMYRIFDL